MKEWLKRFRLIYALNSIVKDLVLSFQSWQIQRFYERLIPLVPPGASEEELRHRIRSRMDASGVHPINQSGRPLHIYCVGTYYDHEAVGFLQALSRLGRVTPYHNPAGNYGLNSPRSYSAAFAREWHSRNLVEQVRALNAERQVDVVIGTMTAQHLKVEALSAVRRMGIPVLNIAMDDRLPVHWGWQNGVRLGAIGLGEGVDLTLQTTKEYVSRYLAEGYPAVHWPFGSDPSLFMASEEKDMDVVFVGNNYGKRTKLIESIKAAGIQIECFGNGFSNGHIAGDRVPHLFSRARIVLGTGLVAHSSHVVTLKLRDFDGPMSGSLYITSHNPDLALHYEIGAEIVVYRTIEECVEKLQYYLTNDAEREGIGAAGRARATRDHTWDQRLAAALRMIGIKSIQ